MRFIRFSILLATALALTSCGIAGRMLEAGGRMLHLNSENTRSPASFKLEAREVRDALAAGEKQDQKPQGTRPEVAQR